MTPPELEDSSSDPFRTHREQLVRLRRLAMAGMSYGLWYALALAAGFAGLFDAELWQVVAAGMGIVISQLAIYAVIRSGWNLRFADPSLTQLQIHVALVWILVLVWFGAAIRDLMLMAYLIAMLFGIFALERKQFLVVGTVAFSSYSLLLLIEQFLRIEAPDPYRSLISAIVLGTMIAWATIFGSYVSSMRGRLRGRNEELRQALSLNRKLAERDELTGLYNRRVVMMMLDHTKVRADRTEEPFSVAIVDLDHFKSVNDRYGHLEGDGVLRAFAELAEQSMRGMDTVGLRSDDPTVGRFGGEEFLLVLPDTDLEGATICAERLRLAMQDRTDLVCPVTISAGVTQYRAGETAEALLNRVDEALYSAKERGRNRVVAA